MGNLWSLNPSDWFDEPEIKKTSTLNPEQEELMSGLASFLKSRIGKGLPAFDGQFVAGLSPFETTGLSRLSDYISGGQSEGVNAASGAYSAMLNRADPKAAFDFYQKYYAPHENAYLKNTLIPQFKESQVARGTLRSTGTEQGLARLVGDFGNQQLSRVGDLIRGDQNRAASLIPAAQSISDLESGRDRLDAAFQYGALPRHLEQARLVSQFEEFKRTTPELSPIIDKVLAMLGIQTQAAYQVDDPLLQLFSSLIQAAGPAVGAAIAASDLRLKKNPVWVGFLPETGIGVFIWEWTDEGLIVSNGAPPIGVIAQDVRQIIPDAVFTGPYGYLMVDYAVISKIELTAQEAREREVK